MDDPQNSAINFKASEQRDMRKKKGCESITLGFQGDEQDRNSQLATGWTEEHCQHWDSLMAIGFSFSATPKERTRHENKYTLGVNGQGPKPGPMRNKQGR